jgi:predicted Mrr-cat superfamily restriction endonuclease
MFSQNKTEREFDDVKSDLRASQEESRTLREDIVRYKLITQSMWTLLKERFDLDDDALVALMERVQEENRQADADPDLCPTCDRPVSPKTMKCIYCGLQLEKKRLF